MESNLVDKILAPDECLRLVTTYFEKHFRNFVASERKGTYTGYWWAEFVDQANSCKVYFDGDIGGGFSIKVSIGDSEYDLWRFDRRVNSAVISTEKNIRYQLEVLGQFLSER